MFGNNTSEKKAPSSRNTPSAPGGHSLNSIVKGTSIEGTVKASSDIRIDGVIKGKLFCESKIIVGPTGSIEGEIRCVNAVIEGKVEGTLEVKEMLNIRETARVKGDISYNKLIVQAGGIIDGTLTTGGLSKKQPQPNQKTDKIAGQNR